MPDGTVSGTTSIHTLDNVTYVFTTNIVNQTIVVQRNNTIIDGQGHTLQGNGSANGFYLPRVSNVTIKNTTITNTYGIYLVDSSGNTVSGNNVTANSNYGIYLDSSSDNNTLSGNNITANSYGIEIDSSSGNTVSGNNVTANSYGISLDSSSGNTVSGNNVTANSMHGISLGSSSNNTIYHNSFIGNTNQVFSDNSSNTWYEGYPSGGNYWSDYLTIHPNATEIDSSGIWNIPYVIDSNNIDHYPIMDQPVISEFQPFLLLPLFMTATLSVAICRKKKAITEQT
jgi:parallel beta-helix repeat protein